MHAGGDLLAAAHEAVTAWSALANTPHLVCPHTAFVSHDIGSTPSLFIGYEYQPGAFTLEQAHMMPQATSAGLVRMGPNEDQLWAYLTQLASALLTVHNAGLAVRAAALTPSKVLLTSMSTNRVKIGQHYASTTLNFVGWCNGFSPGFAGLHS